MTQKKCNLILHQIIIILLLCYIKLSWCNNNMMLSKKFKPRTSKDYTIEYSIGDSNYLDENEDFTFKSKKIPIKYWLENKKNDFKEKAKNITNDFVSVSSDQQYSKLYKFYDQLSTLEKEFYDILHSCSIKPEPDLVVQITVSDVPDINSFFYELQEISERTFTALIYDYPEFWWIGSYELGIQSTRKWGKYKIIYNLIPETTKFYGYSKKKIQSINNQIELVANDIKNQISNFNLTTPYSILRYIHDYLITKIEYTLDEERLHIRTIYGALVENKCVCEGYAEAFQYLAKMYDIDCIIARSSIHEWNFVRLNGKWYVVDVTFDDPLTGNTQTPSGYNDNLRTNYFLTGTDNVVYGEKYSDNPDYVLVYSGFSEEIMISYPEIEKSNYLPSELELSEINLFNTVNISNSGKKIKHSYIIFNYLIII